MINNVQNNLVKHINVNKPFAFSSIVSNLSDAINEKLTTKHSNIVFACIGTDRATGDSLGPLVGYKLSTLKNRYIHVYGSLDSPLHAKNLFIEINEIYSKHENPLIIAIDACLGRLDHIGMISISTSPLKPGAGVNKVLPEIGDISITGIVNTSGFMEILTLQSTRLSLVMKMADLIAQAIRYLSYKYSDGFFINTTDNNYKINTIH